MLINLECFCHLFIATRKTSSAALALHVATLLLDGDLLNLLLLGCHRLFLRLELLEQLSSLAAGLSLNPILCLVSILL